MKKRTTLYKLTLLTLGCLMVRAGLAQEQAQAPQAPEHNNVRRAIRWKQFDYTCEGGAKLTVYLSETMAKIRFQEHTYLMKQTTSADGNRYSDGSVAWWGKGDGGFLQKDTPDGDGPLVVKDCRLEKQPEAAVVTGTVSYLQRMALPRNAVIEVQLHDASLQDAAANVVAEDRITLGDRQVPVSFELKVDASKIDAKHKYSVSARILVDDKPWFGSDKAYPVLTGGNPSHVDMVLKQVGM